ncbi:YceI family protein, partial [Aliarcobacter butzleri]
YGDLTIRNVTKNIKLELENQAFLDKQVIFSMKGETKRSYFDISWDELLETGSIAVSDEIKLTINIKGNLVEEPKPEEKKEDKKKANKKVTEKKKETK